MVVSAPSVMPYRSTRKHSSLVDLTPFLPWHDIFESYGRVSTLRKPISTAYLPGSILESFVEAESCVHACMFHEISVIGVS